MSDAPAWIGTSNDTERNALATTYNKKRLELGDAKNEADKIEQAKRRGEEDYDNELPDLERKIIVVENEVTLLKCTLNIYDLTYKPGKTKAEKQMLVDLWQDLERTFKPDKMQYHLNHLNQLLGKLEKDPGYKKKAS